MILHSAAARIPRRWSSLPRRSAAPGSSPNAPQCEPWVHPSTGRGTGTSIPWGTPPCPSCRNSCCGCGRAWVRQCSQCPSTGTDPGSRACSDPPPRTGAYPWYPSWWCCCPGTSIADPHPTGCWRWPGNDRCRGWTAPRRSRCRRSASSGVPRGGAHNTSRHSCSPPPPPVQRISAHPPRA